MTEQKLPPVTQIAVVSFALVIASGIWIASHLPKHVPIAPSVVLLVLSALLIVVNVVLLSRVPGLEWDRFFAVAKWSFVAYLIISGLLEFVFIHDGTRGGELVVLTLSLLIFAVHVPLLIGWTVARYPEVYE
jgi:membrane-bound acyltransferase YfiQ involved in biofilm formation